MPRQNKIEHEENEVARGGWGATISRTGSTAFVGGVMSEKYILQGHTPVKVHDLRTWAEDFEKIDNRRVGYDVFDGGGYVSTVFLGLDHSWGAGPPLLFETMIFGGPHDGYQERYGTWDEADAGHLRAVALARTTNAVDPVGERVTE